MLHVPTRTFPRRAVVTVLTGLATLAVALAFHPVAHAQKVAAAPTDIAVEDLMKAAELPEIRGRGIWSVGSKDIEVQVPNLSHEEAKDEIDFLRTKFEKGAGVFQKLLTKNSEQPVEKAKAFKAAHNLGPKAEA